MHHYDDFTQDWDDLPSNSHPSNVTYFQLFRRDLLRASDFGLVMAGRPTGSCQTLRIVSQVTCSVEAACLSNLYRSGNNAQRISHCAVDQSTEGDASLWMVSSADPNF